MITTCKALPGISDHDILFITLLLSIKRNLPAKRKIYLWSKVKNEDIQNNASELSVHFVKLPINTLSINYLWHNFKNICIRCLEMIPTRIYLLHDITIHGSIVQLSAYHIRSNAAITELVLQGFTEDWLKYHQIKRKS